MSTRGDLRAISDDEVREVYYTLYWRPMGCDSLPAPAALICFDGAIEIPDPADETGHHMKRIGIIRCDAQQFFHCFFQASVEPSQRVLSFRLPLDR